MSRQRLLQINWNLTSNVENVIVLLELIPPCFYLRLHVHSFRTCLTSARVWWRGIWDEETWETWVLASCKLSQMIYTLRFRVCTSLTHNTLNASLKPCDRMIKWEFCRDMLQVLTRSWCSCCCWEMSCTSSRTPCWWTLRISLGEPALHFFSSSSQSSPFAELPFWSSCSSSFVPDRHAHSHQRHQAEKAISK